jgi:site-specific DNA recombinase
MTAAVSRTATAVMYARVSSKDQEREGFSIPAQTKLLREYARQQRLTVLREFVDVETAKQAGRGGFGEMLDFLKANPSCRTILVEKTDRLYRNFRDYVTLEELSVAVHFVKEHTIISPESRSSDKLMHNIKVAMAKNYVDNLSEEVRKGLREKAEQGHWPSVAPVGYVNNVVTHRIEVDPVRGPFVTRLFELYATGEYSLKTITRKAYEIGLRHPRADRRMTKSEIHRMLQRLVYTGEFVWKGTRYAGSHQPLVPCETFDAVQATLGRKPRARYPKQRHAFMGLLTCARCGCAMTAEKKKGKYVYYRCTGYKGACGNVYVREELLADLLGEVITPIQITPAVAEEIATALRTSDEAGEQRRCDALRLLDQRRRTIVSKLDRGYEDLLAGRISDEFWSRKSKQWEEELAAVDAQRPRLEAPRPLASATGERILELAKKAEILYKSQNPAEQRRLLETVLSNCTFDRGSLCPTYTKPFDLFVLGNETGGWRGRRDSNPRPPA